MKLIPIGFMTVVMGMFAHVANADDVDLDQAAKLSIDQSGWDVLASELLADSLPDIDGMPLDDVDDTVDNGVELRVTGLRAWAHFESVSLRPRSGQLEIVVNVRNVKVHADSMRIRKRVLGNYISTTCRDTSILVAEDRSLPIRLLVSPTVHRRHFYVNAPDADFSIPDDEYRVDGPDRCSGALGVGDLIASIVRSVLDDQKGAVEDAVEDGIEDAIPDLEAQINSALMRTFEFEVSDMPPLPDRSAEATTYPTSVTMAAGRGSFELGVSVRPSLREKSRVSKAKTGLVTKLGTIGLNPLVITEVFDGLYPDGTDWTELTEDTVPGIREVVSVQSASGIWPDLDYVDLTGDELRLLVKLPVAPQLETNASGRVVNIRIPELAMHFLAPIGGEWVPYFDMKVQIVAEATIGMSGRDSLLIGLTDQRTVTVSGDWASGYTPEVDIFEQDIAEFLFASVFDYLYASGPIADIDLPVIAWGGAPLRITNPQVIAHYINMDLIQ